MIKIKTQLAISAIIAAILAVITEVNQLLLAVTILIMGVLSALILLFAFWVSKINGIRKPI